MKSHMFHAPLTKLQCCPTSDGSAAAILVSEEFVVKHGLEAHAIEISGITLKTDYSASFDTKSSINLIGADMCRQAAKALAPVVVTPAAIVAIPQQGECRYLNVVLASFILKGQRI